VNVWERLATYEFFHAAGNVHDDNKSRASRFDDFKIRVKFVEILRYTVAVLKVVTLHDDRPGALPLAHVVVLVLSFCVVLGFFAEMNHLEGFKKYFSNLRFWTESDEQLFFEMNYTESS
jgi:hypothetical protein